MASEKKQAASKEEPLEKQLWKAADKLRKNIDAAEYKHVVLGLIFLKYISDSFEEMFTKLQAGEGDYAGADPEDKDEYTAESVFFVPPEARWPYLVSKATQADIGSHIDDAMDAIERENPLLKGVLPKVFARQNLDPIALGDLVTKVIGGIAFGDTKARSADVLGHVFEYFLGEFALAEGKQGGQFYTPKSIVELLVAMLEPYKGRVYDPCCGSGGMFVQSEKFVTEHQGRINDISIYGQESNQTTWRLAQMNLAIRGINASQVKWNNEGSFLNDAHKDLKADFIIANPPFNVSDWSGELLRGDGRWKFGVPPAGNANFAWLQHFIHHLAPDGRAGVVLAKGALTSKSSGEGEIRKALVADGNLVDCIVNLPAKLFLNTQIPAGLWFLNRVQLTLTGKVLDMDYARLLARDGGLDLQDIMALDKVQKRQTLNADDERRLKSRGLIEGRKPNYFIARSLAQQTGQKAKYSKNAAFDKQYYLDLICKAVKEHGTMTRKEVDELLWNKLPEWMDDKQRKAKVGNLLSELRRHGKIVNQGSDGQPSWALLNSSVGRVL